MNEITTNEGIEILEKKPIFEHLKEFKKRLIYSIIAIIAGFVISYNYSEEIYKFLIKPLAENSNREDSKMIYTSLTEAFTTYLKLSIFTGFIMAFPVIAYQIYAFISPGLYKKEKKFILPVLIFCPLMFFLGAAFVYYFLFPTAWDFFMSFETTKEQTGLPIKLEARVADYLSLVMSLIIAFGISFQLPIILVLLCKFGILTSDYLKKHRKYVLVLILIIAGILTPPDIFSQIALSIPLYFLYEISIIIGQKIEKKHA
ncbi:MAG TPA: twin-arginine translocase subunit TatC [Alphaproteobacteria bacterium]|nr:twin-arginine translocase subunit TatC [Alphaproteobacteria bacterium]